MKITKETVKRALRTFIQAAIAYITVNAVYINITDDNEGIGSALFGLSVSALAAGLAAVMNLEVREAE